jgi:hypothetical protein
MSCGATKFRALPLFALDALGVPSIPDPTFAVPRSYDEPDTSPSYSCTTKIPFLILGFIGSSPIRELISTIYAFDEIAQDLVLFLLNKSSV